MHQPPSVLTSGSTSLALLGTLKPPAQPIAVEIYDPTVIYDVHFERSCGLLNAAIASCLENPTLQTVMAVERASRKTYSDFARMTVTSEPPYQNTKDMMAKSSRAVNKAIATGEFVPTELITANKVLDNIGRRMRLLNVYTTQGFDAWIDLTINS